MMKIASGLKLSLATAFLVLIACLPVRAQDEPAVVKALYDTFAELGGERPSHDSLTQSGDTITISGLKLLMKNFQQDGQDVRQEMTADTVVMKNVSTLSEGLFEVGAMTMNRARVTISTPEVESMSISAPVMEMQGTIIRTPDTLKTALDRWVAQQMLARGINIPLMTFAIADFSLDAHDVKTTWKGDAKTGLGEWLYSVGSIELPKSLFDQAGASPSLSELGYETIVFGLTGRSAVGLQSEFLEMDGDSRFLARQMGAITFAMAIGGIQPALIEAAQAVQEAPNAIDVNAMMAMLQTIKIGHLTFRYDDASLAHRLLSYVEKTEGKTRDDIVREAVDGVNIGTAALKSPELVAQIKQAVETFLRDPGWIALEIRPNQPVAVSQIMPLLGTPAEVIKLLNVRITAGPH